MMNKTSHKNCPWCGGSVDHGCPKCGGEVKQVLSDDWAIWGYACPKCERLWRPEDVGYYMLLRKEAHDAK